MKRHPLLQLSVLTVGILHAVNKWIDSSAITKQTSSKTGKYYHWKQGDVFYRVYGDPSKQPLLLLHDLSPYCASFAWTEIAKGMQSEYCVYVPDLPGCGKSDKPAITYTNYFYVQFLTDFVNEVIGQKTHVVVTGISGSAVLMANELNKNLFGRILMMNPRSISSLKQQPDKRGKMLQTFFEIPVIGSTAFNMITSKLNTETHFQEKVFYNPFSATPAILKASYDASHAGNGYGKYLLASLEGNYLNVNITNALMHAENQIHVIFGEHMPNCENIAEEYIDLNETITCEILPDCKKLPQLEALDEVLESFNLYL